MLSYAGASSRCSTHYEAHAEIFQGCLCANTFTSLAKI